VFDPHADVLDSMIDAALAGGRSDDPVVDGLAKAFAQLVPAGLADRVLGRRSRVWWPARIAAAVFAWTLLASAFTSIFFGHWLARAVDNPYAPHIYREGGLAFLATGAVIGWAALRPRWLDIAVVVGTPLGILLGINGASEIIHLRAGALDHGPQLLSALAMLWFWWRAKRRYQTGPADEEEV
jgi:hypothetical protein